MSVSESKEEFTILIKNNKNIDIKVEENDKNEGNFKIEIKQFSIRDFKLNLFDEVIDVRTVEEFSEDRIPRSVNIPAVTKDEEFEEGNIVNFVGYLRGV